MLGVNALVSGYRDYVKVFLVLLYTDNVIITHQDVVWLQEALDVLIKQSRWLDSTLIRPRQRL